MSEQQLHNYTIPRILPTNKYYGLNFWVDPLSKIKRPIQALSDPAFNPTGLATLEVGKKGVEITVFGSDHVIGFLQLSSSSRPLHEFMCRDQIVKTINLNEINRIFDGVEDDHQPVNIMIIRDKPELNFGFPFHVLDHVPSEVFPVKMADVSPLNLRRFPSVQYGLEAVIPTSDLIPMINQILEAETKPAVVILEIVSKMWFQVQDHSLETDPTDRHVWFKWKNWSALKTATNLANNCGIWVVTDPGPHIVFRFDLGEIGDFVLMKATNLSYGKDEFRHLGFLRSYFADRHATTHLN